jgi:hypothetical protein
MIRTRLSFVVLPILMALLGAGYVVSNGSAYVVKRSPLSMDATSLDFGQVSWDDTPSRVVHFVNIGKLPLTIERVEEECRGCMVVRLSSYRLQPGGRGAMMVRFNPVGFSGDVETGVSVRVVGLAQPTLLRVRATVNPLLMPSPQELDFGKVLADRPATARICLVNTSGQHVNVRSLKSSADYIQVHAERDAFGEGTHPVATVWLLTPPTGRLRERISIETSLPGRSKISIPVRAEVAAKWKLSDSEFFFGFANKGERPSRSVVISGLRPSQIRRVRRDFPQGSVRIAPHGSPRGTEVTATLDLTGALEGELSGGVLIEMKDEREPPLRIPLVGIVHDPLNGCDCSPKATPQAKQGRVER